MGRFDFLGFGGNNSTTDGGSFSQKASALNTPWYLQSNAPAQKAPWYSQSNLGGVLGAFAQAFSSPPSKAGGILGAYAQQAGKDAAMKELIKSLIAGFNKPPPSLYKPPPEGEEGHLEEFRKSGGL